MNPYDTLPDAAASVFGAEAVAESSYGVLTVDVPAGSWISALETARDKLGCTYFDWLSAVDEPGTGFRICAHVVALENRRVRRLLLRTTVPHAAASLPSAVAVYAGAAWHERETHEMFGVVFTDHPGLAPLLLPENFEGHPLRKDFVLAARVAKAWPGAKEPGEGAEADGPKRRQMLPPGVPDPNDWGPLKGQLPPAPARPARTARAAGAAARTPREGAPVRRTRSAADGSAGQAAAAPAPAEGAAGAEAPARPARRMRSVSEGSASQAAAAPAPAEGAEAPVRPARRTRSAADGSASQATAPAAPPGGGEAPAAAGEERPARKAAARRSSDAPWHDPKPAFGETEPPADRERKPGPAPAAEPDTPATGTRSGSGSDSAETTTPDPTPDNGGDA
ncbi:NADH-quinone oxidoreductase subunit C [Streptomyces globosus]|uniref:NADH-quinone oxidoreductase subunit C n=1 Tax=Streptomyces globosus TaxID=68209 RepID=A0A344TV13_9ACTN|nr:NADH-quinone oxidoreductase subunit C [Streptomyces globosus]AXE22484.1 NADH-quinone oxidoreductase subunit C [Streptomyces globosus]